MPKKPSQEELNIIQEMFKASVDGELYDPDRFGQYYKPAGFNNSSSGGSTATATAKPVEAVAQSVAPVAPVAQATETVTQPVQATPEPAKVEVTETVTATASEQTAPSGAPATETGGKVSAEDILSMIRSRQAGK